MMTAGPDNPPTGSYTSRNNRNNKAILREFTDYADAQRLVDRLSDAGFPVEHVQIVGTGIRTVEQVTGRMTTGKATLYGAASGAWLGVLIGLIFGLLAPGPAWFFIILVGLMCGALWGAVFGFVAHWATKGQRDFSSIQTLEAERYAVLVSDTHQNEARRLVGM